MIDRKVLWRSHQKKRNTRKGNLNQKRINGWTLMNKTLMAKDYHPKENQSLSIDHLNVIMRLINGCIFIIGYYLLKHKSWPKTHKRITRKRTLFWVLPTVTNDFLFHSLSILTLSYRMVTHRESLQRKTLKTRILEATMKIIILDLVISNLKAWIPTLWILWPSSHHVKNNPVKKL